MINGSTRLVGLIGYPVKHSLSPQMHNAAFDALGLNWRYVAMEVAPSQIVQAVHGLAALGFRGVNVTIPHKQTVLPLLGYMSNEVKILGAANTLVFEPAVDCSGDFPWLIMGYNTDEEGFYRALIGGGYAANPDHRAIVLGAGGAARSVLSTLIRLGLKSILLLNRSKDRAEKLIHDLKSLVNDQTTIPQLEINSLTSRVLIESVHQANLLVNTTPVGMWPEVTQSLWPETTPIPRHLTVYDLVYNPLETRLLQQARKSGAQTISGLDMLVHQGALAFELWTGLEAPITALRETCIKQLQ